MDKKTCCDCDCGVENHLLPILEKGMETDEYICINCIKTSHSYGTCSYCGDEFAYPIQELNANRECPDHYGESNMSDEDREGWEHNIQKWSEG